MMIQLSCCSSNTDYASDHANFLTVLCVYACNFLKEQISVILVACKTGAISNIFIQDTAKGTAIERSLNGLYSGKIPLILSITTDIN